MSDTQVKAKDSNQMPAIKSLWDLFVVVLKQHGVIGGLILAICVLAGVLIWDIREERKEQAKDLKEFAARNQEVLVENKLTMQGVQKAIEKSTEQSAATQRALDRWVDRQAGGYRASTGKAPVIE